MVLHDGNGRVSRLLSLFLLYKSGYDVGKYVSFEEQINESKDFYYEALQESSIGWHTNENSYFEYMKNFLSMLYKCYKELDKRFSTVNGKNRFCYEIGAGKGNEICQCKILKIN